MNAIEMVSLILACFAAFVSTWTFLQQRKSVEQTPYWVNLPRERKIIVVKHSKPLSQEQVNLLRANLDLAIKSKGTIVIDKDFEFSGLVI